MSEAIHSDDFWKETCGDNAEAMRFGKTFVAFCHVLDDVIDRDKNLTDENLISTTLSMMLELTLNPFFVQNRMLLLPLIVQSFNAWLDANTFEKSEDVKVRRSADTLKGFYHEVVFHLAYLTGGWNRLRIVTRKYREYDYDNKE